MNTKAKKLVNILEKQKLIFAIFLFCWVTLDYFLSANEKRVQTNQGSLVDVDFAAIVFAIAVFSLFVSGGSNGCGSGGGYGRGYSCGYGRGCSGGGCCWLWR